MDLADFASEQGELAGKNAVAYLRGKEMQIWDSSRGNHMQKGFPAPSSVTCTLCPNGCQVDWNETKHAFTGNRCPRGAAFAEQERVNPKRVLTTTLRIKGSAAPLVSVKTEKPIEKGKVVSFSQNLKEIIATAPVEIGEEIFQREGIRVLATSKAKGLK